jgi:ribosomal subunit interface protein
MRLQIQGNDQALAQAMRSYIERRLRLTLGRYVGELAQVTVRVADAAARGRPGGGCRVRAELVPSGRLVEHEVDDPCLFLAVDAAVERTGRSVRRAVDQGEVRPAAGRTGASG